MTIESLFDVSFAARLTSEEKQIQQNYRPVIGVHKWFARRPGALFRSLLLAEFCDQKLSEQYYRCHDFPDLKILDPFMGGGTTMFEANRIGCNVVGFDINPMAYWIVRQELVSVDRARFREEAARVIAEVSDEISELYHTECRDCGKSAPVKYFFWVKQQRCGGCKKDLDLFPGYLIAGNTRHPNHVVHCPGCRSLVEFKTLPEGSVKCPECSHRFTWSNGSAARNKYTCECGHQGKYPVEMRADGPPRHRLIGIEYHCADCKAVHEGRFFKSPDTADLDRVARANALFRKSDLEIPRVTIPEGDETNRLHRWGYSQFHEMFNERQLLSLGLLMKSIRRVADTEAMHALATVFSDTLRYQNMLCRYDSYALKCQDIFSVHGFPVGLIQCENNVLGIPGIGSGAFSHFIEKYDRAKEYCERPFETIRIGKKKTIRPIKGERIDATLVSSSKALKGGRTALLAAGSVLGSSLQDGSFDAVFTDPPYFDNVQYAELADFCYSWLRILLQDVGQFKDISTASFSELTGNDTTGKDLEHFTEGLSAIFVKSAKLLKAGAPFVFTYHHNKCEAYVPIVVGLLDACLTCTATIASPAEMTASLHINGTGSSVMDSVFVSRKMAQHKTTSANIELTRWLSRDQRSLADGGCKCTRGDLYCLGLGHLARVAVNRLATGWDSREITSVKIQRVSDCLDLLMEKSGLNSVVDEVAASSLALGKLAQGSLFD